MKKTNESYEYLLRTVSELESITQSIQTEIALEISNYRAYMLYGEEKYKEQFIESKSRINNLIKTGKDLATIQESKDRLDTIQKTNDQIQQTGITNYGFINNG